MAGRRSLLLSSAAIAASTLSRVGGGGPSSSGMGGSAPPPWGGRLSPFTAPAAAAAIQAVPRTAVAEGLSVSRVSEIPCDLAGMPMPCGIE